MLVLAKELQAKHRPPKRFKNDVDLRRLMKTKSEGKNTIVEITAANFGSAWYQRTRYEVEAGQLEEPRLYEPIYSIVNDSSLPKNVTIHTLGPGGVVFDEIKEGGEVNFVSIGESETSVRIRHYAVGLEYTKDLIMYNELWNVGMIEREAGRAYNALLNHIHLSPILSASYGASNLTSASADGDSIAEKTLRTFEDAIMEASEDTENNRPGPYILLVSPVNRFQLERALTRVPQQGFTLQSSAIDMVSGIIAYNGWTGSRGKKTTSYTGVPAGTVFMIDVSKRAENFQSFFKQDLQSQLGESDMSRFILEQVIWDAYFGVYSNPTAAVQKVTLPTS